MRVLAEFIMRGRAQSVLIAVLGVFFPFLTQACLGLVTLRKGWLEGVILLFWSTLPYVGGLILLGVDAFALLAPLVVILASYVLALVLRRQTSWQIVLLMLVGIAALSGVALDYILDGLTLADVALVNMNTDSQEQVVQNQELADALNLPITAGQIAYNFIAMPVVLGLMLARYMQASLYNPGGFQVEVTRLRIGAFIAMPSMIGFVLCNLLGEGYQEWAVVFALPLLANGVGVAQSVFLATGWRTIAIVLFYVAVLLLHPLVMLLTVLGFSDIWLDYRKRFNLER